jgi:hypothetical protein
MELLDRKNETTLARTAEQLKSIEKLTQETNELKQTK